MLVSRLPAAAVVGLVLGGIAGPVAAGETARAALEPPLEASLDAPFEGYDRVCGYPLIVAPTPNVALAVEKTPGEPVIVVDPVLLRQAERPRFVFFVAHECGHHVLGHVTPEGISRRAASHGAVRDQEMSADCWAAETLARLGVERPVRLMGERFYRAGLYSPGAGYPAGIQRATIIHQCAAVGRRSAGAVPDGPVEPTADRAEDGPAGGRIASD